MKEIWKDVAGYEGLYQVSNLGNVRSLSHVVRCKNSGFRVQPGKNLKCCFDGNYMHVTLFNHGVRDIQLVHRLVALAFINNPNNLPQVNHKDGNKLNNNKNNLEWCTPSANNKHAFRMGLNTPQITHYRGVLAFRANDGSFVGEYKSQHEAAKTLGLSVCGICSVLHNRCKTIHGYYFKYSNKEKIQNRTY